MFLATNHGNAFILLTIIATRARRNNGLPDGLISGDALISSSDLCPSMSRQVFRDSLKKLVDLGHVKIVTNGKKYFEREKSTIKITIKSMLVNLCSTSIYDINSESNNQQNNQQGTNREPTENHKQERIRKNEKEKKEEIAQTASPLRPKFSDFAFDFEKKEFVGISEKDLSDWKSCYPQIDIEVEISKSINWLKANPSKSNKKLWRKFLTGWLSRANETAENKKAYRAASSGAMVDGNQNIESNKILSKKIAETFNSLESNKNKLRIDVLLEAVEINFLAGTRQPIILKYTEKGFKDQLEQHLRKIMD